MQELMKIGRNKSQESGKLDGQRGKWNLNLTKWKQKKNRKFLNISHESLSWDYLELQRRTRKKKPER